MGSRGRRPSGPFSMFSKCNKEALEISRNESNYGVCSSLLPCHYRSSFSLFKPKPRIPNSRVCSTLRGDHFPEARVPLVRRTLFNNYVKHSFFTHLRTQTQPCTAVFDFDREIDRGTGCPIAAPTINNINVLGKHIQIRV